MLYRHWFVLFTKLLPYIILGLLPLIITAVFGSFIIKIGLINLYNFIIAIYYLILWNGVFYAITMFLLDTWLVTDHRILDNEQHGFFSRTLTEASLSKIQDQSVDVKGFLSTIIDYGNLEIQTAGTVPKITMKQIPHPNQVKTEITNIFNKFNSEHQDGTEVHEQNLL
jgi:uncharacterized membrane protein YdbT with pleckstrin-like domain